MTNKYLILLLTDRSVIKYKTMPRTEEQFQEIREQKRSKIINSAIELFAEKGFDATSINMIATRASVSKGLMYNYFESKEDLIKTLLIDGFETFFLEFDQNKDGILTDDEFKYFIHNIFEIMQKNLKFWRLYFMVMSQPSVLKLVEKKLMEIITPFLVTMSDFYKNKGCTDPMARARVFASLLDGVSMNYMMDPENFPVEKVKEIIIEKFI